MPLQICVKPSCRYSRTGAPDFSAPGNVSELSDGLEHARELAAVGIDHAQQHIGNGGFEAFDFQA